MTYQEREAAITEAVARFPGTFGLRGHKGEFRVSRHASHFAFGGVVLYTQKLCGDAGWLDFAKGSEAELRREVVSL
jgi:hypothetical protein